MFSFTVFKRVLCHTYVVRLALLGIRDEAPVDHAVYHAVALQRADRVLSAVAPFVSVSFWWCQDFGVVRLDIRGYIGHAAVAHLHCVSVENFVKLVTFFEMLVD